jgi:hypothetical protein
LFRIYLCEFNGKREKTGRENSAGKPSATRGTVNKKTQGADQELAQWLWDHPRYSGSVVAGWLDTSKTRINALRAWAGTGFVGAPHNTKARQNRDQHAGRSPLKSNENLSSGRAHDHGALESNENFEDDTFEPDENVEEPGKVLMNVLDHIKQSKSVAETYRNLRRGPASTARASALADESYDVAGEQAESMISASTE